MNFSASTCPSGETREMNPLKHLTAIIEEAYEADPEAAKAEYGAEFREDLADFVSVEAVDAVTMWGRAELPPEPGIAYSAFCDPSGGSKDAMTLAVGHLDRRSLCVLDAILEIRPPFDPERAVEQCVALLRRYGVEQLIGDRYAGEWPRARFAEHGIDFEQSARPKSDLYGDLLPLLNAGRIELLDSLRLRAQLTGLERRTARSGQDSIDHGPGAHDDLANAVAGVLVGLDLDRRPPLVKLSDVLADGKSLALPPFCHVVFAYVAVNEANVGVIFAGAEQFKPPLYILDALAEPFHSGFFADVMARLKALPTACAARGVFAPLSLKRHFEGSGIVAQTPPDWFDAEESLIYAAESVGAGRVRFCAPVIEKMKHQTIGAALAFKAGDKVETALREALIGAICLKYDEDLKSRPRLR